MISCFDVECQKAVTMIRTLQAQQTEELQQERQSANQVLETTKAEHHSAIEKHVAEIVALREELELAKKKAEQQAVQIEQAALQIDQSQTQKIKQIQSKQTEEPQVQKVEQPQVQKTEAVPEHKYIPFLNNTRIYLILKVGCSKGSTYSFYAVLS